MPRDERRRAIIEATVPLLREHGRSVTSRQIAAAAGIAEGTVFRVFTSKEELLDAALDAAFDPTAFVAAIDAVDTSLPVVEKLVAVVRLMQVRFRDVFAMMAAMGMSRPPPGTNAPDSPDSPDAPDGPDAPESPEGAGSTSPQVRASHRRRQWRRLADGHIEGLLQPHAAEFRVPVVDVVSTVRLLTFSATHPHIAAHPLEPEEIVDRVLFGVLRRPADREEHRAC